MISQLNPYNLINPGLEIIQAGPYAGNVEVGIDLPANTMSELLLVNFTLTTDANAGNRVPVINFYIGATALPAAYAIASIVASKTAKLIFGQGLYPVGISDPPMYTAPLPPSLYLTTGYSVKLSIVNGVAGDTISIIKAIFRIWPYAH